MHSRKKILFVGTLSIFLAYIAALPLTAFAWTPTTTLDVKQGSVDPNTATDIEITFTVTQNVSGAAGGGINFNMPNDYTMGNGLTSVDVDFLVNDINHTLITGSLGLTPVGVDAVYQNPSNNLIQIELNTTGPGLAVNDVVKLKIGTNATFQNNGAIQFTTGSTGTGTYEIRTATPMGNQITYNDFATTSTITLLAGSGVPEFSTYILAGTLLAGGWMMHKSQLSRATARV